MRLSTGKVRAVEIKKKLLKAKKRLKSELHAFVTLIRISDVKK